MKTFTNRKNLMVLLLFMQFAAYSQKGNIVDHYPNGQIKSEGKVYKIDPKDRNILHHKVRKKIGTWHYYYENGTIKRIEEYETKNKKKPFDTPQGFWSYFDQNGRLVKKEFYRDGGIDYTLVVTTNGMEKKNGFAITDYEKQSMYSIPYDTALLMESTCITGENLVMNPGFEESKLCPYARSSQCPLFYHEMVKTWKSANFSTPDYFHSCSNGTVGVPSNFSGKTFAKSGQAYTGIFLHYSGNYFEYIQTQLKEPLQKDAFYLCKVSVVLTDISGYSTDGFGLLLTEDSVRFSTSATIMPYKAQINNKPGRFLTYKDRWMEISGIYKARGGEKFITIGNFFPGYQTKYVRFYSEKYNPWQFSAYYFIDDVVVAPIISDNDCFCNTDSGLEIIYKEIDKEKDTIIKINNPFDESRKGETYVLENIYFDFDKATLLEESYIELELLYEFLQKKPNVTILISGHTDNIGSDQYNEELSLKRAESVAKYLIGKGINNKRITMKGYGSTKPLLNEQTEEARQKNRRVEFTIISD